MNLVIDIGNTSTKYSLFAKNEQLKEFRKPAPELETLKEIKENFPAIKYILLSATGKVPVFYKDYLSDNFENLIIFDQQTPLPFKSEYKTQHTLGLDRIAAVAGALHLYPYTNTLIIDAGTAITYDLVDSDGIYKGGNISPGMTIRFRALKDYTHKLPLVSASDELSTIGTSTEEAIRNGVVNGIINEIEGTINQISVNYNNLTILLTGGDAQFFDNKLKKTIFVVQNLVSTGLNTILNYNVENF